MDNNQSMSGLDVSWRAISTWNSVGTWRSSAGNTLWCLLGCVVGDFGTILYFQIFQPDTPQLVVFTLAVLNGLLTSIALETILLIRVMPVVNAFRTAIGMSFVSMLAMEFAMNLTDYVLVGELRVTWWSVLPSILAGFLVPWPYNYWRLKKYGRACH